jgi:DNA-binding response OmpR family regulator
VASPEDGTLPIVRALHSAGFAVLERVPGPNSLAFATSGQFDLVAWVARPDCGYDSELLATVASGPTGIIALLADASPEAVAACLVAGADACLALEADERVVVAQAHAVLRRRAPAAPEEGYVRIGDLTVDSDRCEVERAGEYVSLTASEFRIVEFMAKHAGRVLRPHEILNAVSDDYEYRPREAQDVFKVYVRRIRRKLERREQEPRYLVNVRGIGYRLEGGEQRIAAITRSA